MLLIRYKTLLYGTLKTNRQPVNLSLLVFLAYIICIYRLSSIASSLLYTRPHVTAQVVRLARPALLTSSPAVSRLSLFLSLAIISQPRALSLVSLFFFFFFLLLHGGLDSALVCCSIPFSCVVWFEFTTASQGFPA